MSLISTENFNIILQSIKKLLSFKADKTELALKVDKSDITEYNAVALAHKTGLIKATCDEAGAIYTDEKGVIYTL